MIRIAAAGDLHASEATRERVERAFATVAEEADVILLAGDLTTTGEPEQAQVIAAQTEYGIDYTSVVEWENVWGAQFHPERSGQPGSRFLKAFLAA